MQIPTIDISPLLSPTASPEAKKHVDDLICEACAKVGFLRITGHGVDSSLLKIMEKETLRFFKQQSSDEKMELTVQKWNAKNTNTYRGFFPASANGKEGIDMGSPHLTESHPLITSHKPLHEVTKWPANLPGWKENIIQLYDVMLNLGCTLLRSIARALKLDENYFAKYITPTETLSTFRMNYYPYHTTPPPPPVGVGEDGTPLSCEIHVDGSILTLLYQPDVGGLQVEVGGKHIGMAGGEGGGKWIDVQPSPEAIVVNTGLCLQRWTNDKLKAVNHRVKMLHQERISVPFFVEPNFDAPLTPVPTCVSPHNPAKYDSTSYGEYIIEANKRFKEYQR